MEKTLGEQRIRVDFNVTNDEIVNNIKLRSALLIDICDELRLDKKTGIPASGEKMRLIAFAQTAYEEAAMWAVKAATM